MRRETGAACDTMTLPGGVQAGPGHAMHPANHEERERARDQVAQSREAHGEHGIAQDAREPARSETRPTNGRKKNEVTLKAPRTRPTRLWLPPWLVTSNGMAGVTSWPLM